MTPEIIQYIMSGVFIVFSGFVSFQIRKVEKQKDEEVQNSKDILQSLQRIELRLNSLEGTNIRHEEKLNVINERLAKHSEKLLKHTEAIAVIQTSLEYHEKN